MNTPRVFCLFLFLSFAPATVLAQQSLYQSHDGDTSIFLQGTGGVVGANIGKSDIRLSYLHEIMNRTHLWSWGADLSGALKGTSSQLLNGATPAKSGAFNVSVKKRDLLFKPPDAQHPENSPNDDWLIFQVGYQRSQLKLIDTSASPLPAPTSTALTATQLVSHITHSSKLHITTSYWERPLACRALTTWMI